MPEILIFQGFPAFLFASTVKDGIITSYVLKRNRKQANPKESRALFGVWAGRTGLKMPFFLNASLERHSCKSGSISPLEIIPPGHFQQIRMHFSNGNHPSRKFSVDQDAFPAGNHPSRTFPANQDAFLRWESSLQDISSKSGCISPLGIIPPGHFQQIRMHFSARNHPSKTFPANQDAFPRWKSSLTDIFSKSRCISPTGIIPPEIIPLRIIPPQTIPSPTKKGLSGL